MKMVNSVSRNVSLLFLAFTLIALLATGCGNKQSSEDKIVHIGYQKGASVNILKVKGGLEEKLEKVGYRLEWTEFPGGPQLLEALNVGSIDFGHTGDAPPIFAQAASAPLIYLAHTDAGPKAESILVPANSDIHTAQDLIGKKVALNKGSNVHFLLVKYLEANQIDYKDIEVVFLPPADARAAFDSGNVDAWVIWDPFYSAAVVATDARVLADGTGLVKNYEFYLASEKFATNHKEAIDIILAQIAETDSWAKANQEEVAKILAPVLGIDEAAIVRTLANRSWGVNRVSEETIKDQQAIADVFYDLELIPNKLDVSKAFLD